MRVLAIPTLVCCKANNDSETPRNGPENAPAMIFHKAAGLETAREIVSEIFFWITVTTQITIMAVIMRM